MKQLKLYSTIDCQINGNSISSIESTLHKKIILDTLDKFDTGSVEKGLMDYIYNEKLNSKISFAKASVEVIGKELFGVLICNLKSPISDSEIQLLEEECKGLYGDGWGEGFEQVDIPIPENKEVLNVSFFFQFGSFFYKRRKYIEIENKKEAIELLNASNIIENIAFQSERKMLKEVSIFDVYEGENLPEGKKSYAVRFIIQDPTKTLKDKQIDKIMSKLMATYKKQLNAEIR